MTILSTCIRWLSDWTEDLPPILDEYDLTDWLEHEGCESLELLVKSFKKSKVRQEVVDILRGILWEWYLAQRDAAIASLPITEDVVPRLLAAPQTAQKSAAWHLESRDLLTGHEFAGVVYGTPVAFQSAVARKCAPPLNLADIPSESRTVFTSPLNAFQWGWRFEPVVRTLYEEEVADAPVNDTLGRIRHPTLPRLAASPDGVIVDGPRMGRLLEIKAPVSRVLTGIIPQEYYCQMQLQTEVCDVPAVEYVEVRFDTQSVDAFVGNGELSPEDSAEITRRFLTPTRSSVSPVKPERCGAILVIAASHDAAPETWRYAYSPTFSLSAEGLQEAICWKPDEPTVILEHQIWRIADWWTTTVPRNRRWWTEVGQPAYESFWTAVDSARISGLPTTTKSTKSKYCILDSSTEGGESRTDEEEVGRCLITSDASDTEN